MRRAGGIAFAGAALSFPLARPARVADRESDGGRTWNPASTGLPVDGQGVPRSVASLAIDPSAPSVVYAAAGGAVFRSAGGGSTWTGARQGLPQDEVSSVMLDPGSPATL